MSTAPLSPQQASIVAERPLPTPIQEGIVIQGMGMAARERIQKRYKLLKSLHVQRAIHPATILNLSPFWLNIGDGLIPYNIPPCPEGKSFSVTTKTEALTFPQYRGNVEMSDKRIKPEYDVKALLPAEQLMEFYRAYGSDVGFEGVGHGGIVIFEGDEKTLRKALASKNREETIVNVPTYLQDGTDRFLTFEERSLPEMIAQAEEQLKNKTLNMIREANNYYDKGPEERKNIDPKTHFVWVDFGLRKRWITAAPAWRNTEIPVADRCKKCGDQYVSQTGVCKCGYVHDPLLAFKSGEIAMDHVRMDTLNAEQWKEVHAIADRRKAARGEQK